MQDYLILLLFCIGSVFGLGTGFQLFGKRYMKAVSFAVVSVLAFSVLYTCVEV